MGDAKLKNVAIIFLVPSLQPFLCSSTLESTDRRLKTAMRRNGPAPFENRNLFWGVENRNESRGLYKM